ncbi:helix-turn-helix transcriptional regulator [Streptomyces sp. NBC_00669]|uniref:helix-turn-helix domain-containing protein n=1 Tax=Streptomyces sp. NBC_00669 TaxID=2976011 RepID=UPI002E333F0D|nr:helix-turn-helix transcriptional regulator [Streptomyces sp. NBC_00669]
MTNEGTGSMRVFGAVVRAVREAAGKEQQELADHVGYSRAMITRVELGDRMPPPTFVEKATAFLGAGEILSKAAEKLDRTEHPAWFEGYVDLEKRAASLYTYDNAAINGLLQIEEYASALLSTRCPALETDDIESRVQARMARQVLLLRTPLPQLCFVMEESVLRRPVGGRNVLRQQLLRLLEVSQLRHVAIQVLPLDHGAHAGYDGPMHLLETPQRQQLVYLEIHDHSFLVDDRDEVSELNQRYAMIRSQALGVRESAKVIEQIAEEL